MLLCQATLLFLLFICSTQAYQNSVYDSLLKYAYISKISYCIDLLRGEHDLSEPIVLKPKPLGFSQAGFNTTDYSAVPTEETDLHLAKLLKKGNKSSGVHSADDHNDSDQDDDLEISTSEGFFAIDHTGNGTIILSLRGSINFRDYLTDLNTNTIDYEPVNENAKSKFKGCEGCKVHKGFHTRLGEIEEEIFTTAEKLVEVFPDYNVVVTGHSMGGSLAMLVGIEFSLLGYDPLVIAYGNPKVSNQNLSDYMDTLFSTDEVEQAVEEDVQLTSGCLRVFHNGDYIPMLPPGNNKFIQAGLEFVITKEDLPHPKSAVEYVGKAHRIVHPTEFKFSDLFTFDLDKIFSTCGVLLQNSPM
ncbi:putative lipase [Wickerhamomyces ciferrii]|uniref:triacylglycerol lipase n=1 Tax=Wickerhamomyces ciferrii (strain ATCC 14091 / BCRC 22168 / CBS 111 / JCM 3599 / NBRC 0793 / NRRL Y-1031 F-60-10) TaxID=1206466 RepID=K0KJ49_WICCF|nr:putative lipase [Wickerhamomyces ciferrii]CCH41509.1 putative lipase [Wickerhamomyces ciferrii]